MTPGELSHAGPMPIQYDLDARIALIERIGNQPRAADPDRMALLAELDSIVASHPDHITAREVLVTALADAGEPERGRAVLNEWPTNARDSRYWRLRGRWDLEYDNRPDEAATAFRTVLAELPQDWRLLVPASPRACVFSDAKKRAARPLLRSAESVVPLIRFFLGPRLDAAFSDLDKPAALEDLAGLCTRAGLPRLGEAWHQEAQSRCEPLKRSPALICIRSDIMLLFGQLAQEFDRFLQLAHGRPPYPAPAIELGEEHQVVVVFRLLEPRPRLRAQGPGPQRVNIHVVGDQPCRALGDRPFQRLQRGLHVV